MEGCSLWTSWGKGACSLFRHLPLRLNLHTPKWPWGSGSYLAWAASSSCLCAAHTALQLNHTGINGLLTFFLQIFQGMRRITLSYKVPNCTEPGEMCGREGSSISRFIDVYSLHFSTKALRYPILLLF